MARHLRLSFEGACYHITSRGNRTEDIFYSDKDRSIFIERLNETFNKYSFVCYAYCLMDNHYHLFIKTPRANISEGMHYLNTSYTNWFKSEHNIIGSVLQGRYKSILVDEDSYGIKLSAYIHLNPFRAGIVRDLSKYKWSSYMDFVSDRKPMVERLDTEFILTQFDSDIREARKRYRRYVRENINMENPMGESYRGIAVGKEKYIEKIRNRIKKLGKKREVSVTKLKSIKSAEDILGLIQREYGLGRDEILEKRRANEWRKLSMCLIKKHTELKLEEIGKIYNMDYAAVSQSCRRFEEAMKREKRIKKIISKIEKKL